MDLSTLNYQQIIEHLTQKVSRAFCFPFKVIMVTQVNKLYFTTVIGTLLLNTTFLTRPLALPPNLSIQQESGATRVGGGGDSIAVFKCK